MTTPWVKSAGAWVKVLLFFPRSENIEASGSGMPRCSKASPRGPENGDSCFFHTRCEGKSCTSIAQFSNTVSVNSAFFSAAPASPTRNKFKDNFSPLSTSRYSPYEYATRNPDGPRVAQMHRA